MGAPERLESKHHQGDPFDGVVLLVNDVVQVLPLPQLDGQAAVRLAACVRAALVDGDLFGHVEQVDGSFEERTGRGLISLGAQKEVNSVAIAIDSRYRYFLWPPTLT